MIVDGPPRLAAAGPATLVKVAAQDALASPASEGSLAPAARWRPCLELGLMIAIVLFDLWLMRLLDRKYLPYLTHSVLLLVFLSSWRRRRRAGIRPAPPRIGGVRAWGEMALVTAGLATAIGLWAAAIREPYEALQLQFLQRPLAGIVEWLAENATSAAWQQVILLLFMWPICREITRRDGPALLLTAALFGLFHLPSPTLAVLTCLFAFSWAFLYRRSHRLLPLIAGHMVLAAFGFAVVPERLLYELHVGIQAWHQRPRYEMLGRPPVRAMLRTITAPAYTARQGGTRDGFIRGLYRDFLGRDPAAEDVAYWRQRLASESLPTVGKRFARTPAFMATDAAHWPRYAAYAARAPSLSLPALQLDEEDAALRHGAADGRYDLRLERVDQAAFYTLTVVGSAPLPARADLVLAGRTIGTLQVDGRSPTRQRLVVAGSDLASQGPSTLRLVSHEPAGLTVTLQEVTLTPLASPSAALWYDDEPYFLHGFGPVEGKWRWTEAPVARLAYPYLAPSEAAHVLELRAGARQPTRVEVVVNGEPVARWMVEGLTAPQVHRQRLAAGLLRAGVDDVELRLDGTLAFHSLEIYRDEP